MKPFITVPLVLIAVYVVLTIARSFFLLSKTRFLAGVSDGFSREYGSGAERVVVLGDSTAAGVGASRLEETLPYQVAESRGGSAVRNLGKTGATAADVLAGQLPEIPSGSFDVAMVLVSANDATHFTEPAEFSAHLEKLIAGLEKAGAKRVLLITTPNFASTRALPLPFRMAVARRASVLAGHVREIAARHPAVTVVDLHAEGVLSRDEYASDAFHPNAAGYAKWSSLFASAR